MVYMTGFEIPAIFLILIIMAAIWELVWKGFGLWHSARNDDNIWFIAILILNTLGILPIIYLMIQKSRK